MNASQFIWLSLNGSFIGNIMNKAVINMYKHAFRRHTFSFDLSRYLEVELLSHLIFKNKKICQNICQSDSSTFYAFISTF